MKHNHARGVRQTSTAYDADSEPMNGTVGTQHDAVRTLKRLKYLEAILASPNITPESRFAAMREKVSIFSHVSDD